MLYVKVQTYVSNDVLALKDRNLRADEASHFLACLRVSSHSNSFRKVSACCSSVL